MDAEDLLGILIPEGQKYSMNLMTVSFLYFALIQYLLHLKCKCESEHESLHVIRLKIDLRSAS